MRAAGIILRHYLLRHLYFILLFMSVLRLLLACQSLSHGDPIENILFTCFVYGNILKGCQCCENMRVFCLFTENCVCVCEKTRKTTINAANKSFVRRTFAIEKKG